MAINVYWRPLKGKKAYHYWIDDTDFAKVKSACGRSALRNTLEVYIGFGNDPSIRCKSCLKGLERKKL